MNAYCAFCSEPIDFKPNAMQACPVCGSIKFEVYVQ